MGRHLIVANQTLGGAQLDRAVRDRIEAGHRDFYILVPMIEPQYETDVWLGADVGFAIPPQPAGVRASEAVQEARRRSEHRLARMIDAIRSVGGEAEGEVGAADPAQAVKSVLERHAFDEVIVSTLPSRISRWLKMDVPSRVSRMTDIPVTTVEADEAGE